MSRSCPHACPCDVDTDAENVPTRAELEARARQADRDRDDAGRVYRDRVYAADAAWRLIGGRP
jgi:hypothetical protein